MSPSSWNSTIEESATRRASTYCGLLTDRFRRPSTFLYLCFFICDWCTLGISILCLFLCFFSCTFTLPSCFCHSSLKIIKMRIIYYFLNCWWRMRFFSLLGHFLRFFCAAIAKMLFAIFSTLLFLHCGGGGSSRADESWSLEN